MKHSPLLPLSCATLLFANTICSAQEASNIPMNAYIYGYPLMTMNMTRNVMTNVPAPSKAHAPMGQFVNIREYPPANFKDVTAPNADTLYSIAWLDLSKEPYILHVPDEKGRYYLMPMLSNWTEVFVSLGTRTTGTKAHDFAIVGPHWKGALPKGVTEIKAPTSIIWIVGRTYCTGAPEDYAAVHAIQDQYKLTPLSFYGKAYTPPQGTVDDSTNMNTPVRDQVNAMDSEAYFKQLAIDLKTTPPTKADAPMAATLKKLDSTAINSFDVKTAQVKILAHGKNAGTIKNGWVILKETGHYGTDYLQRAFVSMIGLGANLPQDAIYPTTLVDNAGEKLNGANNYVIHFAKGQTPPVNAFWSLTMYDEQYFFVVNPLNKYTVSPRNQLVTNKDGSIDLYIQHRSPGKEKEANWLPAAAGNFVLMFRFYWPKEALINGKWSPPAVKKI